MMGPTMRSQYHCDGPIVVHKDRIRLQIEIEFGLDFALTNQNKVH